MCGFVGVFNINNKNVPFNQLRQMTESIHHRGPDHTGYATFSFSSNKTSINKHSNNQQIEGGIGFNRLSIIDLSELGNQPMIDSESKMILAFNGEIYNAFDYLNSLKMAGFRFKSKSDTEVLLNLFKLYGVEKTIGLLNGMFAICLVDNSKKVIHLVRDRLGIKPLYYSWVGDSLVFGSEIKSFLQFENFKPNLNVDSLNEHLTYRSISNGQTLLKDVYEVLPGEHIQIFRDGSLKKNFYWDVPPPQSVKISFNQSIELLDNCFDESVHRRLLSDVKIGTQLSGGVDSSLVTAYATKYLDPGQLDTISIDFDEEKLSERNWIDSVVSQLGIKSHVYNLSEDYFLDNLKAATWHLDQPIVHPNSMGIFLLSKKAKDFFTVFLSGEGADELFAGYSRFYLGNLLDQNPAARLPLIFNKKFSRVNSNYNTILNKASFNKELFYIISNIETNTQTIKNFYPEYDPEKSTMERLEIFNRSSGGFISKAQYYELKTFLPPLLIRQDKMTMASSIENRVPFLDHKLVSLARSLSPKFLLGSGTPSQSTKYIIKKLDEKIFSKEHAFRKKMGFSLPIDKYLKSDKMRELLNDEIIPSIKSRGLFNPMQFEKMLNSNKLSKINIEALWSIINFEIWARQFLDKKN